MAERRVLVPDEGPTSTLLLRDQHVDRAFVALTRPMVLIFDVAMADEARDLRGQELDRVDLPDQTGLRAQALNMML